MTKRTEVFLPKMHPAQARISREARRFNVASLGRRSGKTVLGIRLITKQALAQRRPCAWIAPSYKLLDEAWRESKQRFSGAMVSKQEQTKRIELYGGGSLDFWTLEDDRAGSGRKYARMIIDEAAHSPYLKDVWEQSLLPTLTDYQGDAFFCSTPAGHNYFHTLYQQASHDPQWQSWQMPTTCNPHISAAEVENMRRLLPERVFRQEYLAEFIADGAGVFRGIDRAPTCAWQDAAQPNMAYVIGVDWGRHNDFTVFSVMTFQGALVHLERFTDIGYELQVGRLKALWQRFGQCPILAESNSLGGPLIERLQRERLNVRPFQTTNASKADAIEALSLALENGQISLADDDRLAVLKSELLAYDQERLPSGLIRYGAPPGQHDDCVMALAIAWHGVPPRGLSVPQLGARRVLAGV